MHSSVFLWLKVDIKSFISFSYATFKADTCMQCIHAKIGLFDPMEGSWIPYLLVYSISNRINLKYQLFNHKNIIV